MAIVDTGGDKTGGFVNVVPDRQQLTIIPCWLTQANSVVAMWHRHHQPVKGAKFCLAVADEWGTVVGVAIVGRPVARHQDDGWTLEVARLATDGTPNACSALYGACWRAARALGYRRLITYTLPAEGGASLRGAGWALVGETPGRSWNVPSRPREDTHPLGTKWRWQVIAGDPFEVHWPERESAQLPLVEAQG